MIFPGGLRWLTFGFCALLLAACETARPPLDAPPVPYPESLRERLVEQAEREWRAFGGGITDLRGPEREELRPALSEDDPRVFHLVQGYWNAVREERDTWPAYIKSQRARYREADAEVWRPLPWSAAFISYLMRSTGVDRSDFYWSAAHSYYLDHAIRMQQRWGGRALYTPMDLETHRPEPGDLLCADRSRPADARLQRVAQRVDELGEFRGMHCDLVVARHSRRLALIGGNLGNAVRMIYLPLDAEGRVPRGLGGSSGQPAPFVVLRLNLVDQDAPPSPVLTLSSAK
ncbi:DUF2272 domain-containing protein [Aquibaculum sediminis]|uniref:DUF2272 domain-containing protein n=1 Tax=Aquibaculum sediminis TaxID=3231907 RepID=UPI003452575E